MEDSKMPAKRDGLNLDDFPRRGVRQERRNEPRANIGRPISVSLCRGDTAIGFQTVNLVDCSIHGISFVSPVQLTIDEQFMVRLDVGRLLFLTYTVRNCREIELNWRIGALLFGIVGGMDDKADEIMSILLGNAVPEQ